MWSDAPGPEALEGARRALVTAGLGEGDAARVDRPLALAVPPPALAEALCVEAGSVWLDDGVRGRHLLAVDPVATLRSDGTATTLQLGGASLALDLDGLGGLQALAELAPPSARLFGSFGYELAGQLERLPPPQAADQPGADLEIGLYTAWIEIDERSARVVGSAEAVAALHARAEAAAGEAGAADAGPPTAPGEVVASPGEVIVQPDDAAFEAAVARTVGAIHAGRIFETNLCRRFEAPCPTEAASLLYRRLRRASPAEFGAYLVYADRVVLSVSPECFLRRRGGWVESRPIKGTRRRGADERGDRALVDELLGSEKDAAELAMIVDLVRHDLGRVCEPGSVEVAEHRGVMRLPGVLHTFSRIVGTVAEGRGSAELLRATFPPGSITGAPKIEAIVVAHEEERVPRGAAMGAIGWLDPSGDLELSVAIRTAVVGGGKACYHAGAGIVADSQPAAEQVETRLKARPFLEAIRAG